MIKKNKDGRPPLYETAEELQAAVDQYFKMCEGVPRLDARGLPVITDNGLQIYDYKKRATLGGLSHYLGFKDRQTFTRQKRRGPDFTEVVLLARLRCEAQAEAALFSRETYSAAAYLLRCSFGWDRELKTRSTPAGVEIINQ